MAPPLIVATFDAVGGPAQLTREEGDRYWAGPTDAGIYTIARCGKHSSASYPDWSTVRWGSEIKEVGGDVKVMHEGRLQPLKSVSPRMTREHLMQKNYELYKKYELPKKWLFNDFGHITCYFFKDANRNGKLDRDLGETIHREYFHTTPEDEAATAAGKPVTLAESHGCIHLKPNDIDTLIGSGYFKAGNRVVVHEYREKMPLWSVDAAAAPRFEVHFFPGMKKLVVTGQKRTPIAR